MYAEGKGVKRDYAEAAKWYRMAAEQGNRNAQVQLMNIYRLGQGVKQDYAEALFWDAIFARDLWSDDRYSDKHLTAEQSATVKKRVQDWKKSNPAPAATPTGK